MLIVMCFIYGYKQLHSWIPESMQPVMNRIKPKLFDVSGFGLILFSKSREEKVDYSGNIGKLWSWMVTSAIAAVVARSAHEDFEA